MELTEEQIQFLNEISQESFQKTFDEWVEHMELEFGYPLTQVR